MRRVTRFIWLGVISLLIGGFTGYRIRDQRETERLLERTRRLEEQRRTLEQIVARLTTERRVADIYVTGQTEGPGGRVATTDMRWVESGPNDERLADHSFTLPGDVVYFDGLVIKFLDEFIERGDELRGHSLVLFQRAFSADLPPRDGFPLDRPGEIPAAYRTSRDPGAFERQLWSHFWDLARDPEEAHRQGVRVAQGEAVYAPLRTGEHWRLSIERDGGLNLVLQAPASPPPTPLATAGG